MSQGFSWVPWWNRHPAASEKAAPPVSRYPEVAVSSGSDEEDPAKPSIDSLASRNILVRGFKDDEE